MTVIDELVFSDLAVHLWHLHLLSSESLTFLPDSVLFFPLPPPTLYLMCALCCFSLLFEPPLHGQSVSFSQLSSQGQKVQERLKELEKEVSGGATAVVALILNNKLYIANVGMNTHFLIPQ